MKYQILAALLILTEASRAQDDSNATPPPNVSDPSTIPTRLAPIASKPRDDLKKEGVQWKNLLGEAGLFLLLENGFRYATEEGTRNPGLPYFKGYLDAVGNLHGWADGDPFYVNYVGHPMQGSTAAYLFTFNDLRYRNVEFGKDPAYWKSRLRAGAFAWAYSEWTEIGPFMSEAAIGNIQAFHPQQGFVDHVVTPVIGMVWMVAEDAMDRYVVRYVESRTEKRYIRILVRGGTSPSRSLANVLAFKAPWDRPRDQEDSFRSKPPYKVFEPEPPKEGVAPFEFAANSYFFGASTGICAGGGATGAFRLSSEWQMVLDVNGCKMAGLEKNLTGDSLTYMVGPRWTPPVSGRLVPYAQVLFGGNKLTQELMYPQLEAYLDGVAKLTNSQPPAHSQYTKQFETNGYAVSAGMGLDLHFNRALGIRLAGLEYLHTWNNELNGFTTHNGLQLKAGLVIRMGNW